MAVCVIDERFWKGEKYIWQRSFKIFLRSTVNTYTMMIQGFCQEGLLNKANERYVEIEAMIACQMMLSPSPLSVFIFTMGQLYLKKRCVLVASQNMLLQPPCYRACLNGGNRIKICLLCEVLAIVTFFCFKWWTFIFYGSIIHLLDYLMYVL